MNRAERRQQTGKLKKMSESERMDLLVRALDVLGKDIYNDCIQVLKEEFGFGPKRIAKFTEAFHKSQRRHQPDPQGTAVDS